jgi:squalene-associated FAD-dependent desaturase
MFDVTVIGGGFAGLSAAVALGAGGARVHLLEARPGLGGRASSFRDSQTGEWVDNGQHLIVGGYHETLCFLRTIGTDALVSLQHDLEVPFVDPEGRRTLLRCPPLPSPWHLLAGLFEWEALSFKDRLSAFGIVRPIQIARQRMRGATEKIAASPDETVENWLARNGQSPRLQAMLWEPLALAALNQPVREAAAPPFTRVLAQMFGPDRRDAALGLPSTPLESFYAGPAREFIDAHGGVVRTNAAARIRVDGDRLIGVESGGETLRSGAVIAAVPWYALADLIVGVSPAIERTVARATAMRSSPIVTVNLWFDRPVLDAPFVGLPGRAMQWVFDTGQLLGRSGSHLSAVASGAGEMMTKSHAEAVAIATRDLFDAFPERRDARLIRANVVRERRATCSLSPGQPGRPSTATPIDGLLLAGDWIDTGLPGTIESAVTSGHLAARVILG